MLRFILKLVHFMLSVMIVTCDAIHWMKRKLVAFGNRDEKSFYTKIQELKKLEKLPVHLTILLGDEEPLIKDLSNIVLWSLFAGISFISFYDNNGLLTKAEDKFQSEVLKLKQEDTHIIWHSNHNAKHKNGLSGRKIHVKIYTENDGRESIAQVTKKLAKSITTETISIDSIDKLLNVSYEFPDPDMGLYCGNSFILNGYPPWQIRVTEFFNLKSYQNIHFNAFINLLCNYSKCDRRLGK